MVSDAQGHYSFPGDRIQPGKYNIAIRAVGYELPSTSVDVTDSPAHLALQLNKVTGVNKLAAQLTNVEWRNSLPGTPQEKARPQLFHLPHAPAHHVLALQPG